MKSSARGLTTATLALATALSVSVAGPHRAYAAPSSPVTQADGNLAITVLSPMPHTSFAGVKPIEVSAFYQGSESNGISAIELYVDGSSAYTKHLAAPEARGVISFLIDVSQLAPGAHTVVMRAIATDAEVVSAKTSFVFVVEQAAPAAMSPAAAPAASSTLPELSYVSPASDEKVSGTVKILLKANDASGKAPYVSLFIDRTFKTLRNYAPYEYDWDTTSFTNGYHTIEAYGYDEAQNVGPAQIIRVYVNNPGGRTELRTDLKDGAAPQPAASTAAHKPLPARNSAVSVASRRSAAKPTLIAKLPSTSALNTDDLNLSSPFVAGTKAAGPSRRPSPLMSVSTVTGRSAMMRPIMMAKRTDLLDRTGGLDPQSQLSDPFIPDTATPKPITRMPQTPTTGFKSMPKGSAPTLATASRPKAANPGDAPALLNDAHTIAIHVSAPALVAPTLNVVSGPVSAKHPAKSIAVHAAAPKAAAKPIAVHTAAPVAAPKSVAVHVAAPAATATPLAVHTAMPTVAPAPIEVHTSAPVIQAQPIAVHAAAPIAAPKRVAVHAPAPAATAKPIVIHTAAPVAKAAPIAVHAATPAIAAKPLIKAVIHAPMSTPHHTIAVHTLAVAPSMMRVKGQMKVLFNHAMLRLDRPLTPRSGIMFSPLRQIFEFQGGSLTWSKGEVHATSDSKDIMLKIGQRNASVNQKRTVLEQAPYLDQGRTMVPLSFLPLALDVNVQYDAASGRMLITTKN